MKKLGVILLSVLCSSQSGYSQVRSVAPSADTIEIRQIGTLELKRGKKQNFRSEDSVLVLEIDTLIMKDRSALQFFGVKTVKLKVKHAEIGKRVYVTGIHKENNASNFDIDIRFAELGSLYVMANGQDARNGFPTDPNGDGGKVQIRYDAAGIHPQQENRRAAHYLYVDVSPGGLRTNASMDVRRILGRIDGSTGVRGLPQGRIFSGSPGRRGEATVTAKQ